MAQTQADPRPPGHKTTHFLAHWLGLTGLAGAWPGPRRMGSSLWNIPKRLFKLLPAMTHHFHPYFIS